MQKRGFNMKRISLFPLCMVLIFLSFALSELGSIRAVMIANTISMEALDEAKQSELRFSPAIPSHDTSDAHSNLGIAPLQTITLRTTSRGANAAENPFQYGVARFFRNGTIFYERTGGGGGGRGFNIAAINPLTGNLLEPVRNFDTWGTRDTGAAIQAMTGFLNGLPNGTYLLIAVCDDAGLNQDDSCNRLNNGWNQTGIQTLESLGSTQIRNYCFRNSWCMVTVKGEGRARGEGMTQNTEVSAETTLAITPCPTVSGINPISGPVGSNVVIMGTNFTGVNAVKFSNNASATFAVNSNTQLTAIVPNGAVPGSITIGKPDCPDVQTSIFTVTVPCHTFSRLNPASGNVGSNVIITGNNFADVISVNFFSDHSATFTVTSATQITVIVPAGATSGPITISKSGCNDVRTSAFTVQTTVPGPGMLYGLNFSPYTEGQDPNQGSQISKKQLKKRMRIIAPFTKWIRTFGTSGGLDKAGQVAHNFELKAAIGAWLSRDLSANEREISALIDIAQAGNADFLIVGSEVLLRDDLSEAQLIAYINRVKQSAPGIPVTTGDVYGNWLSHPNLIAAVDVVFVNIYPYWEGASVNDAIAFLDNRYQQVKAVRGDKPVIISETGWPSCGNRVGDALPSPENASFYFRRFVAWARANDVPYFYFEAFEEAWKAKYEGPQGACWGIWDQNGNVKPGMQIP